MIFLTDKFDWSMIDYKVRKVATRATRMHREDVQKYFESTPFYRWMCSIEDEHIKKLVENDLGISLNCEKVSPRLEPGDIVVFAQYNPKYDYVKYWHITIDHAR